MTTRARTPAAARPWRDGATGAGLGAAVLMLLLAGGCIPSPTPTVTSQPTSTATATFAASPTLPSPPGVGDCDGVPALVCDAAVSAVLEFGLDPKIVPQIASWRVRPTTVAVCNQDLQPTVDVTFVLGDATEVTVTVGRRADGRFLACTY